MEEENEFVFEFEVGRELKGNPSFRGGERKGSADGGLGWNGSLIQAFSRPMEAPSCRGRARGCVPVLMFCRWGFRNVG